MIALSNFSKAYGQRVLFNDASFHVNAGEKIGLVGSNGAGKSTLFKILTKQESVDTGHVSIPEKLVIGYFSQEVGEMHGRSALEEVMAGAGPLSQLAAEISRIEKQLEESATNPISDEAMERLLERYGEIQSQYQARGGYELETNAKTNLTGLGIGPEDYNNPVESFSGGWKMRIALAQILTMQPDVLLMDEPTNHLDVESIEWLEEWIKNYEAPLVMTSHDREFMNRIVNRIVEAGNKTLTNYSGNYDFYEKESVIRREQLISSHKKQQDMLAKEEEFIARFAARASHAAQVQSRVKKLDKIDRIEIPPEEQVMHFHFAKAPRSGDDVVALKDLSKVWTTEDGRQKPVFSGITGMVRRLEKVAVTGVNGAGKSTLLKVITGQTEATSGSATIGASVSMGYFSQHSLEVLDPKSTIFEEVFSRVPDPTIGFVRSLLGAFLFSGDDVHKKISVLSGGEKSRVVLATLLATPLNFLVLDEPTNHLDIKSREVLLRALQEFEGTLMIVSHDRFFLRALVNRVFEVDHGQLRIYDGTYDEYRELSQKNASR
jgi:ATP-binding cassette, subfamily F, member 3